MLQIAYIDLDVTTFVATNQGYDEGMPYGDRLNTGLIQALVECRRGPTNSSYGVTNPRWRSIAMSASDICQGVKGLSRLA